jgi:hypothetical protein
VKNIIVLLILIGMVASTVCASNINKDNWISHPEIIKIRKLYKDILEKSNNGTFKIKHRKCELYDGNMIIKGTIFRDKNSMIRRYILDGGTGDSAGYGEYYYTAKGLLRFAFLRVKAVNGTHSERRIYFDNQNNIIYEDYKLLKGPGYFSNFSKNLLDPEMNFQNLCNE